MGRLLTALASDAVCGWPLGDAGVCGESVEHPGARCAAHRIVEAGQKAAAARRARARPARVVVAPPPLSDEDAAAIFAVLDRHRVDYVVIGGMAAAMWGSDLPRTIDADITPSTDAANLARLAEALNDLGARLRVLGDPYGVPAPLDAAQLAALSVLTLITAHGPLDVTFHPDGVGGYAELAPRASLRPVGDHPGVPVADLADVIASKTAAGRAKDLTHLPSLRRLLARLRPPRP